MTPKRRAINLSWFLNVLMIDKKHCLNMNCDCPISCARVLSLSFFPKDNVRKPMFIEYTRDFKVYVSIPYEC